MLGLVTK